MKNSISKTLLCGILASSFLLANCQPGPKRAVKGQTGTTPDTTTTKPQVVAKSVECSKDFLDSYYASFDKQDALVKRVQAINHKTVAAADASDKVDLTTKANELAVLLKPVNAAITKMGDADNCTITDAKDKSKKTIDFKNYMKASVLLGNDITKITDKKENDLAAAAKPVVAVDQLEEIKVSSELGDVLTPQMKPVFAIVNGDISTSTEKYSAAIEKTSVTACVLDEAPVKLDSDVALQKIVSKPEVSDKEKRNILLISFLC